MSLNCSRSRTHLRLLVGIKISLSFPVTFASWGGNAPARRPRAEFRLPSRASSPEAGGGGGDREEPRKLRTSTAGDEICEAEYELRTLARKENWSQSGNADFWKS